MALNFFYSQSLVATNFISEREQLRPLKNEQLKCEKVTQEVKECSRTSTNTVKRKFCIKKTNTFTIVASNFVREQLICTVNEVTSTKSVEKDNKCSKVCGIKCDTTNSEHQTMKRKQKAIQPQ